MGEPTPMVMTIARDGALIESTQQNIIPKERYVSQDFFDLEMERLWPRVWQMACREEEVPRTGDFLEYVIGDQSILVTRSEPDDDTRVLQHLSASGHPVGHRSRELRHR